MITELEFKSLASQGFNRIPLIAEAFADLWTADAVWKLAKPIEGRDAIGAAFTKLMKGFAYLVQTAPNAVFEVDETTGVGNGRVLIHESYDSKKDGPGTLVGVYHDRYQRVGNTWLFAERFQDGRPLQAIGRAQSLGQGGGFLGDGLEALGHGG